MASLIQQIAVQAYQTFGRSTSFLVKQQNLTTLKHLMKQIVLTDLCIDESLFTDRSPYTPNDQQAPIDYISVWSDPCYSMGVFVLRNRTRLPLHDHPGMNGLVKVIHGSIDVTSYSRIGADQVEEGVRGELIQARARYGDEVIPVRELHSGLRVDTGSDVVSLDPDVGNFHEIRAVEGPAAFLDILAPPYDEPPGSRGCNYYEAIGLNSPDESGSNFVCLVKTPLPDDYWSDSADYRGPAVDPYSA